jgi:hypothetical protein
MKKVTFFPQKLTPPSSGNHGFDTVILTPGLNEIPDADWRMISTHPVFRLYKEAIEMEEGEPEDEPGDEPEDETPKPKMEQPSIPPKSLKK